MSVVPELEYYANLSADSSPCRDLPALLLKAAKEIRRLEQQVQDHLQKPPRTTLRTTHTYATLEVSATTYNEVKTLLTLAAYGHAFDGDLIDMHGIALTTTEEMPAQVLFKQSLEIGGKAIAQGCFCTVYGEAE